MNPNVQIKDITLAANGTTRVDITGSFLLLQASTGSFNFSLDGGPYQKGFTVLTIDVAREPVLLGSVTKPALVSPQFTSIIFQDTSGVANALTFVVANFPVTYAGPSPTVFIKNAPTYSKAAAPILGMASAGTQDFSGVDAGKLRKQFVVTNNDAALVIQVLDAAGVVFGTVYPQRSWTIECQGKLTVKNPNGGALTGSVNVGEVYYS